MAGATSCTAGSGCFYRPKALLDIPRRIFRPPDPGAECVGRVAPLSLTPVYEVKLEDVLAGKHLPPLTLTEFEAYLIYTARSPENLHFVLWFKEYEKQYSKWKCSSTYPAQSASLAANFSRAKEAFLTASSPLELNLPETTLSTLKEAAPPEHPEPSALADVSCQVDAMLRESLYNFVRSRTSNAGRNRGIVAIVGGLFVMCIGIAPILMSVLRGHSKWLRFAALPCFWFGCTATLCGLNGVCLIIYLFGDARQLTVYEVARPTLNTTVLREKHTISRRLSDVFHRTSPVDNLGLPKGTGTTDILISHPRAEIGLGFSDIVLSPLHPSGTLPCQSFPYPPNSPAAIAPFLSTEPNSPVDTTYDFARIPTRMPRLESMSSPPFFVPLARVLDRISIRTYWETFVRSTTLALLVAFILVGVSFVGT